jgi:hypothetical protein
MPAFGQSPTGSIRPPGSPPTFRSVLHRVQCFTDKRSLNSGVASINTGSLARRMKESDELLTARGTTMGWVFWASDVHMQGDPRDDTIANRAPHEAREAGRSGAIQSAASGANANEQIPGEIRRRQRMLLDRYVAITRVR